MNVVLLAPAGAPSSVEALIACPPATSKPFSHVRRATLASLSSLILRDPVLRADAASIALAYWLRRSNVDRLNEAFERRLALDPDLVHVPVGRIFHVAPGNVDTVFVYSWALAYLCGNQNIVRVSGQHSDVLCRLLALLSCLMQDDAELAAGNRFITYEHDEAVSTGLSRWANHRVLWGGDETVSRLRALPLSPHSSERAFGSKYSWSVVSVPAYLAAEVPITEKLAEGFFNDIFWFDQMACSSPHMLVWTGSREEFSAAIDRFHATLAAEIQRRNYQGMPSSATHRLSYVFDLACEANLEADLRQKEFLGVRMGEHEPVRKEICGGGLFTHVRVRSLLEAAALAAEDCQTVTQFGFPAEELREFATQAGAKGIDRIVPIGQALAFDPNWDGFDLIGDFLRRVTVRV
jgi:hypothetical protein